MPSIPSIMNNVCIDGSLYYLPVIYSSLTDGLCVAVLRDKFPDSPELQIFLLTQSERDQETDRTMAFYIILSLQSS
ncbi:hypothetical protein BP00DRAFT_426412 [Aspergillus indologenus CBS 114.80]|uniref:Uncharacterized protein n=1 Tax=Aspergillus indologenus CBS 114.80 TaxID=1450541 RepID=A0A2V5I8W1_9EURO|nr:hypothetical protein BP00DRAFT_426412 [Aspergillus indologenus CBS 114.80]